MSAFFSSDGSFSLQFAIIFVVIFLILAGGVFLLRRLTGRGTAGADRTGSRGRQPRLGIVDIYELDRQRQLILLRRDNVEHLLLVGGPNDVVVERNITRSINARLANEEAAYDDGPEPATVAVPMPAQTAVSQDGPARHLAEPFPPRPDPAKDFAPSPLQAPYREPSFEMPVVVPAPVPGSDARPQPAGRPLDLSADDEEETRSALQAAPARTKDSAFTRVIRRTPPSLANLVPAALADRVRLPERASAPSQEPSPEPLPESLAPPVPEALPLAPVVAPPAARGIDAAILSDMARQLEEALRRPAAAVRPAVPAQTVPEAAPIPSAENPSPEDPSPEDHVEPDAPGADETAAPAPAAADAQPIDPVAAAMAEAARQPASASSGLEADAHDALFTEEATGDAGQGRSPAQEPATTEPLFVEIPVSAPDVAIPETPVVQAVVADAPQVEAAPAPVEHDPPPFIAPAPQPPAPEPPASKPPTSKPAASPNPFSVEEIEAEFARLLGRPLDRKQ